MLSNRKHHTQILGPLAECLRRTSAQWCRLAGNRSKRKLQREMRDPLQEPHPPSCWSSLHSTYNAAAKLGIKFGKLWFSERLLWTASLSSFWRTSPKSSFIYKAQNNKLVSEDFIICTMTPSILRSMIEKEKQRLQRRKMAEPHPSITNRQTAGRTCTEKMLIQAVQLQVWGNKMLNMKWKFQAKASQYTRSSQSERFSQDSEV